MIYTSYARLAIIVALLSESAATPVAQDQTSVHLEKRTPQSDIEDAKMFLPGSSAGGLHGTSPKGAISKSQSKSSCRGSKCKLPRMTLDEFLRRDMDLKFINTDGELERTFSNYARVTPQNYKDYLIIIKQMEISNKKRKAEEKKAAAANKKKETAEQKETKEYASCVKGDLEGALAGSSSETDATGRSQVPRVQAKKLYISRFGVVSFVETRGSRENPVNDKAYFKLLSTLSDDERTEWGLKPKSMLP
ncbi:hypothetical protein BSLG_004903 [Batrachochytrium salamandrivorans]|nr:hypothetical protein BSLG_004903 [Batrachochytrium salamandrivorans]